MEKVKYADLFLVNDFSPISRTRRVHRRVKIIDYFGNSQTRYLTEFVYHWDDGKPFNQIFLENNFFARMNKIINTIKHTYSRAPFFKYLADDLFVCMVNRNFKTLSEFNFNLIKLILAKLNIKTKTILASKSKIFNDELLAKIPEGFINRATYMSFEMCRLLRATTYISGQSGPKYLGEKPFINHHIKILYQKINFKPYPQFNLKNGNFIPGLSVIDLIFNCGPESERYIGKNSCFSIKL